MMDGVDRMTHTTPIFYKYRILKFDDVYRYFMGIYMFKARNLDKHKVGHNYFTRQRELAVSSFQRSTLSQHSVSFMGPHIWNDIPNHIRSSSSLPVFKKIFKNYLIEQYR